jgi:AsmA-like C-terminal region
LAAEAKAPERKRAASMLSRLRELARRQAAVVVAGALAIGSAALVASQRGAPSFIADAGTLNHAFVRAAEETIRRRLGFSARVSEVRLERSQTSHTVRATMLIDGGGVLDLQVNLNDLGLNGRKLEHTGLLRGRDIRVPRDSVVGDILQKVEERETPPPPEQPSARPKHFAFDSIRVPFAIGHGQLIVHDAVFSSALANVALRGKVDLTAQTVNVSGTYLAMPGPPRFGIPTLLTGSHGDGIFGIRFAILGPMAEPEVIVNPMWLIPPGMIRKIFDMPPREETNQ